MSAKGLPPAVRLDPLIPLPLSSTHNLFSHYQPECGAKLFRPPPSSYAVAEAPMSMSETPPISNNQAAHVKPRGLTPIIITPSSSRAHTPVQLLPLPPSLAFSQLDTTTLCKTELKKIKIEPKVEPVNLEPLLPMKREETPRVTVVVDDDEIEQAEARMHVHRNRNDKFNHQLPTPHATPVTQALDTTHNKHNGDCNITRGRGPEPEFRYTPLRTGKTVSFASLHLDNVRPLSLDPEVHSQVDSPCPEQGSVKERDVVDRGRKRERGPSRFRTHERTRQRPAPYDPDSRPGATSKNTQEQREKCTYTGKLNLGDIAAAAALAMNEADQVNSTSGSTGSSHSLSSNPIPITLAAIATTPAAAPNPSSSPTPSAAMPPRQQNMLTPTPTPPHHNSIHQQPMQNVTNHRHSRNLNDSQSRPSRPIHDAADEMIMLFSGEFQAQMAREHELMREHLSRERQKLSADMQREREALEQLKMEVQRDRERLQREKETLRGQVEGEILAENEALKTRVVQLQAALNDLRGGSA